MSVFKCTIFFQMNSYGWSESYAQNRQDTSYVFAMSGLKILCSLRSGILGSQASIIGQRVSDYGIKGDGQPDDQLFGGTFNDGADTPFTSVLGFFLNGTRTSRKTTYFRGVPDGVVINGGRYAPGNVPGFAQNMANLLAFLSTPQTDRTWGWVGRPSPKPLPVTLANYTIDPTTSKVTLLFTGNIFNGVPVGTRVSVFLSGINAPAKCSLNGTQVVTVVAANSAFVTRPIAVFPYVTGGQGTYAGSVFQAIAVARDLRVTERKAGKAFFVERGRRAVRPRG